MNSVKNTLINTAKLREIRTKSGLTQAEVAKKAGTNTNYYAKVERSDSVPSLKMLSKIVKILDTKSSDILRF